MHLSRKKNADLFEAMSKIVAIKEIGDERIMLACEKSTSMFSKCTPWLQELADRPSLSDGFWRHRHGWPENWNSRERVSRIVCNKFALLTQRSFSVPGMHLFLMKMF